MKFAHNINFLSPFGIIVTIFTISCNSPTIVNKDLPDCSALGLTYSQPDSTSCICIDIANWNADSTACGCDDYYSFTNDNNFCVLDTSSHEFIWEPNLTGYYGRIYDMHIINENDIWAVGDIRTDSTEHNMAHWNGVEWQLHGLESSGEEYWTDSLVVNYTSYTIDLNKIEYISENDIWVTSSCLPRHWDGEKWTLHRINNTIFQEVCVGNTIFSISTNNIYLGGRYGNIAHYDGTMFNLEETNTDIEIEQIEGTPDGQHLFAYGYGEGNYIVLMKSYNSWDVIYHFEYPVYYTELGDYSGVSSISVI